MKKMILTFGLTCSLFFAALPLSAQTPAKGNEAARTRSLTSGPDFVAAESIQFKGDGVVLAGVLSLPKNKAGQKVPAILIVADFYSNRDGIKVSKGVHNTYLELANHFVQRGFAVLRYDRRCTGESECATATMAVAADDGVGAVQYLRGRKEIDPTKVFVFGHGDGSFIATGIAGHKDVAGVITTVAPGRTANKLLKEWAQMHLQDHKVSEAEGAQYMSKLDDLIRRLAGGGFKEGDIPVDTKDEFMMPLVKSPDYAYSWLLDDPLALYPLVPGGVLVVHGSKDRRVKPREGDFIRDALTTGEHKDFQVAVMPEMDYYLKANKGVPSFESDNNLARPLDPALLKLMDEWLAKRLK